MSSTITTHFPRQRRRIDVALVELVRAVAYDDGWSQEGAAQRMLAAVSGDPTVLRVLKARVARALLARPTHMDLRAAAVLELALAGLAGPARRESGGPA